MADFNDVDKLRAIILSLRIYVDESDKKGYSALKISTIQTILDGKDVKTQSMLAMMQFKEIELTGNSTALLEPHK